MIRLAERSFDFAQYALKIKGLVMRLEDYKWEEGRHTNNLIELRYKSCNSVKSSRLILKNSIRINKVIKCFLLIDKFSGYKVVPCELWVRRNVCS